MTDPAFQAYAMAAGCTQQQGSLLETAVPEAFSMARPAERTGGAATATACSPAAATAANHPGVYN
eukprot:6480089-Amphidinium_carterae.1